MKSILYTSSHNQRFMYMIGACITIIFSSCQQQQTGVVADQLQTAAAVSNTSEQHVKLPDVKGADENWWKAVEKDIYTKEYYMSADGKSFQASNPTNHFRAKYKADNFQLLRADSTSSWTIHFKLINITDGGNSVLLPLQNAPSKLKENKLEFDHGNFVVQYENNEAGVRQNVIVHKPLKNNSTQLRVNLKVSDEVTVNKVHNQELHLSRRKDHATEKLVTYNSLKAWDAEGKDLVAYFETKDHSISWVVNVEDAIYPVTIDPISSTANSTIESNQANASYGFSVAPAGDVNGDGYSDVIVGAPLFDNGETNEGRAFLYHGSASGLSTTANWTAESNLASANFGYSVSTAGDVNGDGYSDVIIAATGFDNGETDEGQCYVYHGSSSGLSATANWTAEGNSNAASFGSSVNCAGDVNGDGFSDVIIGASNFTNGEATEGAAFVYQGAATGLNTSASWTIESNQAAANLGNSVASAGDVNGDGYSDVIAGAIRFDNGQADEGRTLVFHGSSSGLSASANWSAESDQAGALFGNAVASAGDVNGDGYSDVIVGASQFDNIEINEGRVHVYHGSASGLNAAAAWTAESNQISAQLGYSVACSGDVNGDGYSDIIAAAYAYDNGQTDEGRVSAYFGSATGLSSTASWTAESNQASAFYGNAIAPVGDVNGDGFSDLIVASNLYDNGQTNEGASFIYHGSPSGLSSTMSWRGESNQASAYFGFSTAYAGDVNGDGYSDVIVGAYMYDNGQTDEGRAYVYHGSATGLSAAANWTAESNQATAYFGYSVASAGDVNGDGYADVIVGSSRYDNGESEEGRAYVYHGSATGLSATANWTAESNKVNAFFGSTVASAGDVNADGYGDVVVGSYTYDNDQLAEGRAFVYYGSAGGLNLTADWMNEGNQNGSLYGYSVASAGDVNGDGYGDVIIGALTYISDQGAEGRAFVYHGSSAGLSTTSNWFAESNQSGAAFGCSVASAGDVNGDGYGDVIVGSYTYDGGSTDEGKAFVYYGSSSGLNTSINWTVESNQASAFFGMSVASAGDVNADGYGDVVVGANQYSIGGGQANEGWAFVYHGSSTGLSSTANWTTETNQSGAQLGTSVGGFGDINGDGYTDVIAGAGRMDNGQSDEGNVFLFYGNNGASVHNNLLLYNTNLTSPISASNIPDAQFGSGLFARSFVGRSTGKLVWETRNDGFAFSSSPITNSTSYTDQQAAYTDLGLTGTELKNLVYKALPDIQTRLRARVKFNPATAITGQLYGPWRYGLVNGLGISAMILPADYHFHAMLREEKVYLNWGTEDNNSSSFVIERSTDGKNFDSIGVKSASKSTSSSYQFLDEHPVQGINNYRLRSVSMDGKISYSRIQSVSMKLTLAATVYPNPVNESSMLSLTSRKNEVVQIQLFDGGGKLLWKKQVAVFIGMQQIQLPISEISPGNYMLFVNSNSGSKQIRFLKGRK